MTINEKMTEKFDGLAALIGHTPMLEISLLYKGEPRVVYAKAEYYNYSGSIKDRVACHILRQAYETSAITEGMPIAEATSGNTGIAFAAIGAYLGNPVTIFMPDWMSKERINLIESFGATIRLVSKAEGGFTGSIALADRMGENEGAFLPHQFSNPENCAAHYATTGKEILAQLAAFGKRPQGFVAGVGTGGTLMGVKDVLQETYPDCLAFPLDPASSPTMATCGKVVGPHRIFGIGDEFVPAIVKLDQLDNILLIDDCDAINMSRKLARVLGLGVGISSGANFLGVLKAQDLLGNKDAVVATVFADDNKKYLSTDLMYEQTVSADHLACDVELISMRAIR
ncbi:PLP-dependent cysteine synthase family protein [Trichococcus shcherbakoviae]|uniref:Cysteine synthase family protein n=1 Tax=Trichococcus shcherbakoviae subsp. psychrophilus TaxID=2585775 RepID=A0A5C5E5S6_9LACT|nr:cysteine synthase family protein [Trichococcus shcherbakoviae]TNV68516.1 cysteine synthase family protein [Trichococcus shcherbakoviae subsp. psychrophilus]